MKKALKFNLELCKLLFIALILVGCKSSPDNFSADLKIKGHSDIRFFNEQKTFTSQNVIDFNKSFNLNIKELDVQNHKRTKVRLRFDNISNTTYTPKKGSIRRLYKIKSTIIIDTVIFQNSKNEIDHLVKGHSEHEVAIITNRQDTLKHFVSTKFNVKMNGTIKQKYNDLVIDYLIEKSFLEDYIQDVLQTIRDKK